MLWSVLRWVLVFSLSRRSLSATDGFNEAYAQNVFSELHALMDAPWVRKVYSPILPPPADVHDQVPVSSFAALYNSRWPLAYDGDGYPENNAHTNGAEKDLISNYVDVDETLRYAWSLFKPYHSSETTGPDYLYVGFLNGRTKKTFRFQLPVFDDANMHRWFSRLHEGQHHE